MPLYKTLIASNNTKVFLWKIEESYQELAEGIVLTHHCHERVSGMLSEIHQRGFMSVRKLLAVAGYTDSDLFYDVNGKPHLKDGKCISITHSFIFSGIIISDTPVGIDIEMQREKILKIANKFTPLHEYRTLANDEAIIRKLTIVWGAKEAIYKLYAQKGVSFLHHIDIKDFHFEDATTMGDVIFNGKKTVFQLHFFEFEGYTCVYALPQQL